MNTVYMYLLLEFAPKNYLFLIYDEHWFCFDFGIVRCMKTNFVDILEYKCYMHISTCMLVRWDFKLFKMKLWKWILRIKLLKMKPMTLCFVPMLHNGMLTWKHIIFFFMWFIINFDSSLQTIDPMIISKLEVKKGEKI